MYLNDPGSPDQSDFRRRVSHRLAQLSKICDDPIGSSTTVSTCVPEDSEQCSPMSSPQSASTIFARSASQPMSPPSSISRNMSDPSLSMSWESPLRLLDASSLREAYGRTPPRSKSLLLQLLEPSESAAAEEKCRAVAVSLQRDRNNQTGKLSPACRAAVASLYGDRKHQRAKLGAASPFDPSLSMSLESSLAMSLESSSGLVDPWEAVPARISACLEKPCLEKPARISGCMSPPEAMPTRSSSAGARTPEVVCQGAPVGFYVFPRSTAVARTPPRSKSWLCHVSEPAGSPSAEKKCRRAAASLERDMKNQTAKLGAADPYVECMREQAKELRRRADKLKWNKLVSWHERNVYGAMRAVDDGDELDHLEVALRQARDSELGPGHWIVRKGKQHLLKCRKQVQLEHIASTTEVQERRLADAILIGDLHLLASAIEEAASTIGSSHRSVEAARDALREQRREMQRSSWCALVEEHRVLMLQACATNDIEQISARIWATANSELGVGHPILEHGKDCIRDLKRLGQRAELDFYRRECCLILSAPEIAEALAVS